MTEKLLNPSFDLGAQGWQINNPTGGPGPIVDNGSFRFNRLNETSYGDSIQQSFSTPGLQPQTATLQLREDGTGVGDHTFRIDITNANNIVIATTTVTVLNGQAILVTLPFTPNTTTSTIRITNTNATNTFTSDGMVSFVSIVCFASGTLIKTQRGEVAVEDLAVGDKVLTADHGHQPIRWIGSRKLDVIDLRMNPKLRPIRIRAGALGNGLPERDMLVSPQHRMLVSSKIARNMFGSNEVLAAAKQLLLVDGIEVAEDIDQVTYWHFLCNDHEIVWANGSLSESLHTGVEALKSVGADAQKEIFALFPELRDRTPADRAEGARPLLTGRQARKLAQRHVQKNVPLSDLYSMG